MRELSEREVLKLIEHAKQGEQKAREILVENNLGLVWSIVRKFQNRGYELEDLFQIGSIGLIKAIHKFDANYDVKLSTYAVPMIMGEIKRFIRDDGIIKVSRSVKELAGKAQVLKEVLTKKLGREPTIGELADELGVESEELVLSLEAGHTPESLYSCVNDSSTTPVYLLDKISGQEEQENSIVNRIALREILESLAPREKQIIVLRYFKEKTQSQIADMLGISQVQVSRIEKKILSEMRDKMGAGVQ